MNEVYREAFSEIDAIFELMPINLLNKIPEKFRNIIKNEKSANYKPIISEPIEEYELKEETIIILALIYRDFLSTNEERELLKLRDAEKIKEAEKELYEKYNPNNLFKKTNIASENNNKTSSSSENQLIVYEEKWFKIIFNIIKNIFKKD